jgi:hypothetical protein
VNERDDPTSEQIEALRQRLSEEAASVMIFLGAGLSYGVGRALGRAGIEALPPIADDKRFPTWPLLIDRMTPELVARAKDEFEQGAYERFIERNEPLDVAQLYRLTVGDERYFEFLDSQFETRPEDAELLTPSHRALVDLPIREVFTTNYDGLIEVAFERFHSELIVSPDPASFLKNKVQNPEHHLVKLHGTWDDHASIVLTRDDYARSRMARAEMFDSFAQEARFTTFLFVGFSLADPTFNLIRDEARAVMGVNMPTSYLVQEYADPVTQRYLESLKVEIIRLFSWNELPGFLRAINPNAIPPDAN